jgi:hypothetical protein
MSEENRHRIVTGFHFGEPPRIARCPYCGVGRPLVPVRQDFGVSANRRWAVFSTICCGGMLLAVGPIGGTHEKAPIETLYPSARGAAAEMPDPARHYLQQALETRHAPDAAAVMAGSAVDVMLKHFKLIDGSVYSRIDQAVNQHILTPAMGEWAREVRLGSNRPRHADPENPHVSAHQAQQSVEFVEALGHYLLVLSSRVKKGIEEARVGENPAPGGAT